MGRRGVQQLTPAEWREALEQQIREKEKQRANLEEGPQRRSQSAPQQEGDTPSIPGLARASTTPTCQENCLAGRRRCFQQQSREEYLKGLHEQIEEKKRLAQEAEEKEQSRRRRMSDEIGDDAEARREICGDDEHQKESSMTHLELQNTQDAKPTGSSNQDEVEPYQSPLLKAEVVTDPVAITKIVDFCEELKKQNEDVKKQLLEQHTVLASLHSSLAREGDRNDPTQRRRSASKIQTKSKLLSVIQTGLNSSEDKQPVKLPVLPRPRPARGETKIPFPGKGSSSSLRSAGADIVKRFASKTVTQPVLPLQKAEEKTDICIRANTISTDYENKTLPSESLSKSLDKEHTLIKNKIEASCLDNRDSIKRQAPTAEELRDKEKDEEKNGYSAKEIPSANIFDLGGTSACIALQPENVDDELPMYAESKLVHDWESYSTGDELLECTSTAILDGPSSLVSLDQPVAEVFQ